MKKKNLLMLSSAVLLAFAAESAQAQVLGSHYDFSRCGSGLWFSACWFGASPSDGNAVFLSSSGNAGYTVTYDTDTNVSLESLHVGSNYDGSVALRITNPGAWIYANSILVHSSAASGGQSIIMQEAGEVGVGVDESGKSLEIGYSFSTGSYLLTGGVLATNHTTVGNLSSGSGTFTQDGATGSMVNTTHQTNLLTLGRESGSHGVYTLGVGMLTSNSLIVGDRGTGEFTQSAPLNSYNSTGSLVVAKEDSAVGIYTMHGGWLFAGSETIGRDGIGTFTHSGGLNDVTGDLVVGSYSSGIGTYSMRGMFGGNPELRANNEYVGKYGTGSFDQYGGTNTVTGSLTLGKIGGSSGSYLLDGDGTLSTGFTVVGGFGDGVFTQHTGSHTVGGGLYIGDLGTGRGVYNLYGGSLSASSIVVGNEGTGWFNQTTGSNTVGSLIIGNGAASSGAYTLDDWNNLYAGTITVGSRGVATFTQNAGTVNAGSFLDIGLAAGSVGTYTLNGGRVEATNITVGMGGTGVFNQTGGQNVHYNGSLSIGAGSGSGTYNMSGGWMDTGTIRIGTGTGTGTFNHTGGNAYANETLIIGANGTYNMSESGSGWTRMYASSIANSGTVNFNGGSIETAGGMCSYCGEGPFPTDILNNGTFNIGGAGERQISGVFVNNGTMKITDTTVRFSRDFTNNGAYISDPSTNIFSSLMVSETGYLVGGAGDNFQIWNDFINYSTQASPWNTADATLSFRGWETHQFYLGGWDAASSRRFSWGTLELSGSGDLFFSGDFGAALYVDNLILGSGTTLNLNGFDLYYTTLTDNGGSFTGGRMIQVAGNPGGGAIPAVPEPSMLLLFGSGLAGLFGVRGFGRLRRGA